MLFEETYLGYRNCVIDDLWTKLAGLNVQDNSKKLFLKPKQIKNVCNIQTKFKNV